MCLSGSSCESDEEVVDKVHFEVGSLRNRCSL